MLGPNVNEHKIIQSAVIHTRDPESTVKEICDFLNQQEYEYSSMGVAAFGPICLDKSSTEYGYVTTTPKEGWKNFPLLPRLKESIKKLKKDAKIGFDTDVNCVALFENLNAGGKIKNLAYITVGTGIGVGIVVGGQMVHGLIHPEGGHIRVPILPEDKDF
jgi:fructokinase